MPSQARHPTGSGAGGAFPAAGGLPGGGRVFLALGLGVLLVPLAASARADGAAGPAAAHTDIRSQLLSEFRYVAHPPGPPPAAPFLSATAEPRPAAADEPRPDLIEMAPYTVRETVEMDRLHRDLEVQKSEARTAAVMGRLGVGLHVARAGNAFLYAATVFYIPIAVGGGFSF